MYYYLWLTSFITTAFITFAEKIINIRIQRKLQPILKFRIMTCEFFKAKISVNINFINKIFRIFLTIWLPFYIWVWSDFIVVLILLFSNFNYFLNEVILCSANLILVILATIISVIELNFIITRRNQIIKFSNSLPKHRLLENIIQNQSNTVPYQILFNKKQEIYNLDNNFAIKRKNIISICESKNIKEKLKAYWNCILNYDKLFLLDNSAYKMVFPGCFAQELKRTGWIN